LTPIIFFSSLVSSFVSEDLPFPPRVSSVFSSSLSNHKQNRSLCFLLLLKSFFLNRPWYVFCRNHTFAKPPFPLVAHKVSLSEMIRRKAGGVSCTIFFFCFLGCKTPFFFFLPVCFFLCFFVVYLFLWLFLFFFSFFHHPFTRVVYFQEIIFYPVFSFLGLLVLTSPIFFLCRNPFSLSRVNRLPWSPPYGIPVILLM